MLYKLGRTLQFIGLFIILPLAMAGQMAEKLTLGQMFVGAFIGIALFYAGWSLASGKR